jgi:hypothetical protein
MFSVSHAVVTFAMCVNANIDLNYESMIHTFRLLFKIGENR